MLLRECSSEDCESVNLETADGEMLEKGWAVYRTMNDDRALACIPCTLRLTLQPCEERTRAS